MKFTSVSKKVLSSILIVGAFSAVLSFGPVKAETVSFKDISSVAEYAKASVSTLADNNIISGDNGYFHPLSTVKRSEMVKMIVNTLHLDISNPPETPTFTDVPKTHWAYPYVEAAYKAGIIEGISPNVFGADRKCTREEMASMYVRALGLKDNDLKGNQPYIYVNRLTDKNTISAWAKDNIEFAMSTGIMQGDGAIFGAKMPAQRQQAAVVTDRFLTGTAAIRKFADRFKGEVVYPELYSALKDNYQKFNGNVDMNLVSNTKDSSGGAISSISMGMSGAVTADTAKSIMDFDINYDLGISSMGTSIDSKFRVIKAADKYYVQYQGSSDWSTLSAEDMLQLGATPEGLGGDSQMLLSYYRYADITKKAVSDFNGASAVKYTMTFKPDALEAMMSAGPGGQAEGADAFNPADMKNVTGNIVVYLNDKNQVISENVTFAADVRDEVTESYTNVSNILTANYSSSETPVVITAPVTTQQ